jgi:hypothetical protein
MNTELTQSRKCFFSAKLDDQIQGIDASQIVSPIAVYQDVDFIDKKN